jgi:hypothetical protein
MNKDTELFEGISIMSPQDMEESLGGTGESTEEVVETVEEPSVEPTSDVEVIEEPTISAGSETVESTKSTEEDLEITDNRSTSDNGKIYAAIVKDMMDEGIILGPEDEEELKGLLENADSKTIKDLMSGTVDKAFQAKTENWKNSFSGAKKKFLEIEDAYTDADQAIQVAQRLEFFENLSEDAISEDENLQKNIYYEFLKSKGFSDSDAVEAIEEADAIDKLKDKALKAAPQLKEQAQNSVNEARKYKEAEFEKEQQALTKRYESLMGTIDERETFIDGLKLNKIAKDKLKSNITSPVYKDDEGNEYTSLMYKQKRNPIEFEMLINYYDSIGLFNLDKGGQFKPDVSKIKQVAKTKAVSELDKIVSRENERGVGRASSDRPSERQEGIINMLETAYGKKGKK